jgi:hypothetical protein
MDEQKGELNGAKDLFIVLSYHKNLQYYDHTEAVRKTTTLVPEAIKGFTIVHATGRDGQRLSIFYIGKKE